MDNIKVRVQINSVDVEMRCKECGNGVAGVAKCPPESLTDSKSHFEAAAKSHSDVCTAQHRPLHFDFVVTGSDLSVH